jgi:SAM-dependent methyltransferase
MANDLTSATYWGERQEVTGVPRDREAVKDLLDAVEPYLKEYRDQQWIELGCSPGHISALLYRRLPFKPSGVDFSPQANLYKESMRHIGGADATLYQYDIFDFFPPAPFDVVMSFGLIEHFTNPDEILEQHIRICRKGGLIVVSIPHFRKLQWLYHYVFDRTDLSKHNIDMMHLETFRTFAERKNLEILFLDHVGGLYFWNFDETGSRFLAAVRKFSSLIVRGVSNRVLSRILPRDLPLYAPWIIFVARCR